MKLKLHIILAVVVLFYGCKQHPSQDKEPYIVDNLKEVDFKLDIDSMTNSSSTIEAYFDVEKDSIHILQSEELCKHIEALFLSYFINEYAEKIQLFLKVRRLHHLWKLPIGSGPKGKI